MRHALTGSTAACARQPLFLDGQRLALVNVSSAASDPSRELFRELVRRGNQVFPVRPGVREVEGCRAYPRVQDVPVPLAGAILLVAPHVLDRFLADCVASRVRHVWIATSPNAADLVRDVLARFDKLGIETASTIDVAAVVAGRRRRRRPGADTVRWLSERLGLTVA